MGFPCWPRTYVCNTREPAYATLRFSIFFCTGWRVLCGSSPLPILYLYPKTRKQASYGFKVRDRQCNHRYQRFTILCLKECNTKVTKCCSLPSKKFCLLPHILFILYLDKDVLKQMYTVLQMYTFLIVYSFAKWISEKKKEPKLSVIEVVFGIIVVSPFEALEFATR